MNPTKNHEHVIEYAQGDEDFVIWLRLVNDRIEKALGLGLFDVADYPLRDAYDAGESPFEIADEIALEQGWDGWFD